MEKTMTLPKQVEQQLKEVEEIEDTLTVKPEGDAASPDQAPQDTLDVGDSQVAVQPVASEPKPEENWEQKYRSLQGHFNAEMPRLQQQNKELISQLQTMQQQIAELQKTKQAHADERLVTDADEDQYGADLIDLQRRVTREVMKEFVNPLKDELAARDAKIAALEAHMGKTSEAVTNASFEQRLLRAVPDFDQINTDPKWISWLDDIDPYTSEPRRLYAEFVYNSGDVEKLKKIVDFYKASVGAAPTQQRQQRQTELERQVQPARTASSSTVPQGERIYTTVESDRLWNKVRELYTKGQNADAAALENDLSLAYAQGRVRP